MGTMRDAPRKADSKQRENVQILKKVVDIEQATGCTDDFKHMT